MSAGTLRLAGTVLDRAGRPAAGATVMWLQGPVPLPDVALLTGADGSFIMSAPVPGPYRLACRSDAGGQATLDVTVGPQGARVTVRLA
jgi:Carboxypeptidase regulatory-like domain